MINEDSDAYIKSADEWIALPGSIEAIAALSKAGYCIAIATNQSGLGRGLFDLDDLEAMHDKLCSLVEAEGGVIDGIFYCPHTPEDNCECRKPKAGLIDAIEAELELSAKDAFLVGDSLRDLEAGIARDCLPVLVKTGKGEKTLEKLLSDPPPWFNSLQVVDDLDTFTRELLA